MCDQTLLLAVVAISTLDALARSGVSSFQRTDPNGRDEHVGRSERDRGFRGRRGDDVGRERPACLLRVVVPAAARARPGGTVVQHLHAVRRGLRGGGLQRGPDLDRTSDPVDAVRLPPDLDGLERDGRIARRRTADRTGPRSGLRADGTVHRAGHRRLSATARPGDRTERGPVRARRASRWWRCSSRCRRSPARSSGTS